MLKKAKHFGFFSHIRILMVLNLLPLFVHRIRMMFVAKFFQDLFLVNKIYSVTYKAKNSWIAELFIALKK